MQLERIGKYSIVGKIGQGAMGEVYKAHDAILNRDVAIKTISADLSADDTLRKRFEREAQSAARLNHPNIITVYDFGEEQGKIYMAMELLEGEDLKQAIVQRHLGELDAKLGVIEQICDGLAFAHQSEIIHRDLKPANIHLLPNGQVKIMDFGLARLSGSEMTRTGMVMGTPHYMSPEQVRGERADARSDVFALGCVMYELLTHRKPFDADTMHSVLFKVMQEPAPPLADLDPDLPAVLQEVIDRALSKTPEGRFQDAAEMKEAMQAARMLIAEGRGDDPLPLPRPKVAPVPGGPRSTASRSGARSADRSTRGSAGLRSQLTTAPKASAATPVPEPAPPPSSRTVLYVGAGIGLALITAGVGGVVLMRPPATMPTPPPTTRPAQIDGLARAVVNSAVELAQKRMAEGNYRDALHQAERALQLDPTNADARRLRDDTKPKVDAADALLVRARQARAAHDDAAAGDALYQLLDQEPASKEAAELLGGMDAALKPRVEDARKAALLARADAEKVRAQAVPAFSDGAADQKDAEAAVKDGRFAGAVQKYLAARSKFVRAQKTVAG